MTFDYMPFTDKTRLPEPLEVREWWDRFGMLDNIKAHSEKVCLVAVTLTDWLAEAGVVLNRRAVEVGALAHDLAKTPCLGTEKLHSQEGGLMMLELGYPELAYLVANHVYVPEGHPLDEVLVVNYADKRVNHESIVGLSERFQYIQGRYGKGDPERIRRIQWGLGRSQEAEAMIFSHLNGRRPEDLAALEGAS